MKDVFGLVRYKWVHELIHLFKLSVTQQKGEKQNQGEAFSGGQLITSELTRTWWSKVNVEGHRDLTRHSWGKNSNWLSL